MLPRFRVAHKQSMAGLFKTWVASHAQHKTAMTIRKFQLLQHTNAFMLYFSVFLFHFYTPMYLHRDNSNEVL